MKKLLLLVCVVAIAGCFGGDPSVGACKADADCSQGSTCNTDLHVCQSACASVCLASQLCVSGQCVAARCVPSCNGGQSCDLGQNPPVCQDVITQVTAATNGFVARTPETDIPVTVVFRPAAGTQVASARLTANGVVVAGSPVAGTTWTFPVPSTVQTPGSEAPVGFSISMTDSAGTTFSSDAPATAALKIDDAAPAVTGLLAVGGTTGQDGNAWFKFDAAGKVSVQATVVDQGSGLDVSTLALRDASTQARIDDGTPVAGADGAVVFHVPQNLVGAGQEGLVHFQVAALDHLGHASAAPGVFGLDGKPPAITFAPGYPAAHAGCSSDANVFCGHDGAHFTRKDVATLSFAVTDGGAGVDPASGSCTVTGAAGACTATFASGSFSFPIDFSKLNVTTDAKGNATIALALGAKDLVGNGTADTAESVDMTRVKWVRSTGITLTSAPIVSPSLSAVIVGGHQNVGDPIAAVDLAGGSLLWSVGQALSTPITQVTGNLALDTTPSTNPLHPTPMLYVNAGNTLYALHLSSTGTDKYCIGGQSVPMVGSPVLFSGGPSATVGVVFGSQMEIFSAANLSTTGGGCAGVVLASVFGTTPPHPVLGPPSASGSIIYVGYNNTANVRNDAGIGSVTFSGGGFSNAATVNLGFQPISRSGLAPIIPAADLFFGDDTVTHRFFDFTPALTQVNASPVLGATEPVAAPPIVSGGIVYGASNELTAYDESTMTPAWSAPIDTTTPPAIGDGAVYTVQSTANQLHAIDTALHTDRWVYGGSSQTTPATTITAPTTEPTLAADGTLYFGDNGGRVYAIITDTPPAPFHPGDWPRTGFDNCNSNHANNPGYICQ